MNITGFKVKPTSSKFYSLFISNEMRGAGCPEISIILPTNVANEIVRRWDIVEKMELRVNDKVTFDNDNRYVVVAVSKDKKSCYLEHSVSKFLWRDVPVSDCHKA